MSGWLFYRKDFILKPTTEQLDIIYSDNDYVYVSARAGTGKTTTLSEFVKIRKRDSFLYIVYNSSIREEAKTKFPGNVEIHTIHSLAYEAIGFKYNGKLTNNIKTEDIYSALPYFKGKDLDDQEVFQTAFAVAAVINRFCNTAIYSFSDIGHEPKILKMAEEYWLRMTDLNDKEVKITKGKKIFVGDEHQRIYSFRGAINIFNETKYFNPESDYVHLKLTKSFRFGKEIATIANKLLSTYKKEEELITGTENRDSVVGILDKTVQYTIISRTNARIFDLAVKFSSEGKTLQKT